MASFGVIVIARAAVVACLQVVVGLLAETRKSEALIYFFHFAHGSESLPTDAEECFATLLPDPVRLPASESC